MNRTIAILLVLAAVGAAVTFVLLDPDTDATTDPELDPGAPTEEETAAGLEGRARDAADGVDARAIEMRITGVIRSGGEGVPATVDVFRGGGVSAVNPTRPDVDDRRSSMRDIMAAQLGVTWAPPKATTKTTPEGAFALAALPSGFYSVWARDAEGRQGYAQLIVPIRGAARHVEIDLAETGSAFAVRVMNGESPHTGSVYVIRAERGDFGGPTARADLDDEGRAGFAALPGSQVRLISFASDQSLAISGPIDIPRQDEYVWALGGETVPTTGKVVGSDDNGIAGATVMVMAGDPMAGMVMETGTTAADGTFSIDVPGQARMFQASAPGYASGRGGPSPDGEILIRMTLLVGVSGQVVEKNGGAVRGARVLAMSIGQDRRATAALAISDANGRFSLSGVEPGEVMVFVLGGGFISDQLWKVEREGFNPLALDLLPEGRTNLTLEVVKAQGITGHVYDGAGARVAGAIVTPNMMDGGFGSWGWRGGIEGVAVTDTDGHFELDALVPTKKYRLSAEAANRPKGQVDDIVLAMDTPHAPVEIRLPAERWLEVTVTGTHGEPVAGARIRAARRRDQGGWDGVDGRWIANAAGVANVGPLPEGSIAVFVESDEYIDEDEPQAVPDAPPGPTPEAVAVTLVRGVTITGRIEFSDETPAGNARVTAESNGNGPGQSWVHVDGAVKADGTFRIAGLRPGRYRVNARSFGPSGSLSGSVEIDAPQTDVVLALSSGDSTPRAGSGSGDQTLQLEIRVVAPDGSTVADGRLRAYSKNRTSGTSIQAKTSVGVGAGEEVWIEVYDLPGGLVATAAKGLYGPFAPDAGSVTVQLEAALSIAGRVVGADGVGVKGVRVVVVPDNPRQSDYDRFRSPTATGRTADDGSFELRGLKAGAYLMDVAAPSAFIKPETTTVRGGDTNISIDLRTGAAPRITVLDYDSKPVEGATVSASEVNGGPQRGGPTLSARTNTQGECVLEGLDPERRYALAISIGPDRRADLVGTRVADWAIDDFTVELERAYITTGIVRGPGGEPVAGVTVWWQKVGDSGASGVGTDTDGRFRIGPDAAPLLDLWIRMGGHAMPMSGDPEKTRVKAGTRDVELVVDPGVELDVQVLGWPGGAGRQAFMNEDGLEGPGESSTIGDSGRVRFPHMSRDKTYRLWIPAGDDGKYVLETRIRGDAGQITVTPERGKSIRGHVVAPEGVDLGSVQIHAYRPAIGSIQARANADGTFEVRGVPDGTWQLYVGYYGGDGSFASQSEAQAGDSDLEITLQKQR